MVAVVAAVVTVAAAVAVATAVAVAHRMAVAVVATVVAAATEDHPVAVEVMVEVAPLTEVEATDPTNFPCFVISFTIKYGTILQSNNNFQLFWESPCRLRKFLGRKERFGKFLQEMENHSSL